MNFCSSVLVVLCCLFVVGSSIRRRTDGYRCPKNVSENECQNYQCPPNSELVDCINFCNTCEDGKVCIDYCVPGCNCKAGFFRDTKGACVRKAQCPKKKPTGVGCDDDRKVADAQRRCSINRDCYPYCLLQGVLGRCDPILKLCICL